MKVKQISFKGVTFASSILTICLGLFSLNQAKANGNGYEAEYEITCSDGSSGYFCRWNDAATCNISGQNCGC